MTTWTESILQVTITRHADGSLTLVNKSDGVRTIEVDGQPVRIEPGKTVELERAKA